MHAEKGTQAAGFNIQVVDLNDADAPEQFDCSLRETGFAVIKNHGITPESIEALYQDWKDFFDSKECQQHLNTLRGSTVGTTGFFPMRSEHAKDQKLGDLKEFYHYYMNKGTELPPLPAGLKDKTDQFYKDMSAMGQQLLGWLDASMPKHIKDGLSMSLAEMPMGGEQTLLRMLRYPKLEGDEIPGEIRAAAHEDINLITLLVTGSEPGLQAKDRRGNWHDVPCDPSYITVNAGDMLQLATGGYYPSTTHQVINPKHGQNRDRFSVPVFVHASPEVVLDKATDKTAAQYLTQRLIELGLIPGGPTINAVTVVK